MRWLRRVAIWWRSRSWLAARVRELESLEVHRLREARDEAARRDAKEAELRHLGAGLRRLLDEQTAGHAQAVAVLEDQIQRERQFSNRYIGRVQRARDWAAANLTADEAAELCALLDLTMPDLEELPA